MMPRVQWAFVLVPRAFIAWSLGGSYGRLRATRHRATTQCLATTSGVFGQHPMIRELHDPLIEQPLHDRVSGVGDLVLIHRTRTPVVLQAIGKPEGVRDVLRRTGHIEAARFDKGALALTTR